jgi:hypothetical protein
MTTWTGRVLAALALTGLTGCGTSVPAVLPHPNRSGSATPATARAFPAHVPPRITYPAAGDRRWSVAVTEKGTGPGLRYRVAVEQSIHGLAVDDFARQVTATLEDPRSWRVPLRRVGPGRAYDFVIYLATPRTRDLLCGDAADGYTSCRSGDSVVLNVARWVKAVPGFDGYDYREYMVNHEVGHRLGHGHERCPGAGRSAPVMQQQTLGLHGCTPNPWPRIDGRRYAGPAGEYDDPVPAPDRGRK